MAYTWRYFPPHFEIEIEMMLHKFLMPSCLALTLFLLLMNSGCDGPESTVIGGTDLEIQAYEAERAKVEARSKGEELPE
jgi:hypothetical protein